MVKSKKEVNLKQLKTLAFQGLPYKTLNESLALKSQFALQLMGLVMR